MKKLLLTLIMLAAGIGISKAANTAGIVMTEQTVDMDAGVLKFVGENTANNYRYTLEAYEFSDRGPRFQLVIDRIDASKPATFTASDLADPNYWEPLFRYFTKQLAGEEIEAAESIKKLYINNVAVLPNQFQGYCDGLNEVYITADGDYTIPDQCFDIGEEEHGSIDKIDCVIGGTLTIGHNAIDNNAGGTSVYTYNVFVAKAWYDYKQENSARIDIYLNGTLYEGEVPSLAITAVSATITANGISMPINIPDRGETVSLGENKLTELKLNSFTATVVGDVTELFMEYAIVPQGYDWSNRPDWKQVKATKKSDTQWAVENADINALSGLDSNTSYTLALSFNTNPGEKDGRAHYPTSGELISLKFTTGDLTTAINNVSSETLHNQKAYDLQGRQVNSRTKGVIIKDGKKILRK